MSKKEEKLEKAPETNTGSEKKTYCYIGPNLPQGALKKNSVFMGTREEILDKFKEEIEKYPQIPRLIVDINSLAEAKSKLEQTGNTLNKSYNDILSTVAEVERG